MIASVRGQFQKESGATARYAADLDAPAQFLNVAAHDIHADAAARDIGYLCRGRETGLEDEVEDVAIG